MVSLPAGPRPFGMPLKRATAEAVNARALAARGGLIATPEVVVDCVRSLDLVVPLTTEVGALGEPRSWAGRCCCSESSCGSTGDQRRKLHDVAFFLRISMAAELWFGTW